MPLNGGGIDVPGNDGGGAAFGERACGDRAGEARGGDWGGAVGRVEETSEGGGADGSSNRFSSPSISPPGDSGAPSGPMKRTFFFSRSEPPDWLRDIDELRGLGASFFSAFFGLPPALPILPADPLRGLSDAEGGDEGRSFGGTGGETTGVEIELLGE